jgi:hypothetical protein
VVGRFAVGREVETLALGFDGNPQADDHVDDLVEDRRDDAAPHDGDEDGGDLGGDLGGDGEIFRAGTAERGSGEDAGGDGAEDAADAMDAEDVRGVVIACSSP